MNKETYHRSFPNVYFPFSIIPTFEPVLILTKIDKSLIKWQKSRRKKRKKKKKCPGLVFSKIYWRVQTNFLGLNDTPYLLFILINKISNHLQVTIFSGTIKVIQQNVRFGQRLANYFIRTFDHENKKVDSLLKLDHVLRV